MIYMIFYEFYHIKCNFILESNPANVGAVLLTSGERIPADIVILGVGARPSTDFLKDSGIPLTQDGGIRVNSYLQVEGFDHIFAGGETFQVLMFPNFLIIIILQVILHIFPVIILRKPFVLNIGKLLKIMV